MQAKRLAGKLLPRRALLSGSAGGLDLRAFLSASAWRTIQSSTRLTTRHKSEGLRRSVLMLPRRKVRLAKLVLEQPDLPKGRDEITSRGRRYAQVMAWVATVALLGGAGEFLAVSTAGASQTAKNHVQVKPLSVKFTLSGAGRGTITDNRQSACDYGGVNTDGATELSDLQGSVSGFKNVDSWTFNIIKEKGNGT